MAEWPESLTEDLMVGRSSLAYLIFPAQKDEHREGANP